MLAPAMEGLVDQIYDASVEPAGWIRIMEQLCDQVDAHTACLTELDIVDGGGGGISARADQSFVETYMTQWTDRNPLLLVDDPVRYSRDWRLCILRDQEWLPPEVLHRTSYYNEFLRPLGAEHSMMVRLSLEGTMVTALNIARVDGKGPFQDREIALIARYQPHLIRASALGRRLQLTRNALDQLNVLLETSSQALLFVNRRGRVRHHTAAAESLLRSHAELSLRQGYLGVRDPATDARLQRLIAMTIGDADFASDATIQVRLADGSATVAVSVSPLSQRSVATFAVEPLVLVRLTVVPAVIAPVDRLRQAYQLTGAEARVALLVGEGLKLSQVAAHCGSSVHTVRAQLGAIFAKTGCHRQTELVRLLLQLGMVGRPAHS